MLLQIKERKENCTKALPPPTGWVVCVQSPHEPVACPTKMIC